jgi:uncharacterized protein (TIGR02598 family)
MFTFKQKKAFTLIEIIMALAILGIGLVSVMAYLPIALDASSKASNLTRASLVAQKVIEDIKLAGYSDINAVDAFNSGTYIVDPQYKDFQYKVDVNPLGAANAKDVIVYVRWQSRGKLITEDFKTKIPKYNPG